ncbi:hypothetical protein AN1V17_41940 [Vallitalea sediminicola]
MGIEYYQGELNAYCYEVSKGTKPVALMQPKTIYVDKIVEYINQQKLNARVETVKGYPEWSIVYIFKDEYLLEVIENVPETPNNIYDHWVLGKLFGYSDAEIRNYVTKLYDK